MNTKITQDMYEDIRVLYNSGVKVKDIADKYSVSVGTICTVFKKAGIPKRKNRNVKHSRFTNEDIEKMKRMYESGISCPKIGEIYHIDKSHVARLLKSIGVTIKDRRKIKEDEYENIIRLYNNGISSLALAKMYSVDKAIILKILRNCSIERRDYSHSQQKYTLKEDYFDIIDTANKAYILGWWYSDGNRHGNNLRIQLQAGDIEILEKINKELGSNRPIPVYSRKQYGENWQDGCRLDIVNKHMAKALDNAGVIENKSLVIRYPDWLDTSLNRHFIRGLFDGDGSVLKTENRHNATITGTSWLCNSIKEIVKSELHIHCNVCLADTDNGITSVFVISGKNNVKIFLDWIYKDAELYLDRKYQIYKRKYLCNENIDSSLQN